MKKIIAAPMAGVSDYAFRKIVRNLGIDLCFTEMINVSMLLENNTQTYKNLLRYEDREKEGVQLFGEDMKKLENSFKIMEDLGFKHINLNMGCPQNKIIKSGSGAALLTRFEDIEKLLQNLSLKLNKETKLSLKIRTSFREFNEPEKYIDLASKYNLDFICIHARSREDLFNKEADWEIIKKLSKIERNTKLIANGDIFSREIYLQKTKDINIDGVMLARGLINDPFIIEDIKKEISQERELNKYKELLLTHLEYMLSDKEEGQALRDINKFIESYFVKFNIEKEKLVEIMTCFDRNKKIALIKKI